RWRNLHGTSCEPCCLPHGRCARKGESHCGSDSERCNPRRASRLLNRTARECHRTALLPFRKVLTYVSERPNRLASARPLPYVLGVSRISRSCSSVSFAFGLFSPRNVRPWVT